MLITLFAFDLTQDAIHNEWLHASRTRATQVARPKHLPEGFMSPMGFWLSSINPYPQDTHNLFEITIGDVDPNVIKAEQTIKIKPRTDHAITLHINGLQASVITNRKTWEEYSDAILLIITQYWRFSCIDHQLHHFSNESKKELSYASAPSVMKLHKMKPLVKNDTVLRGLLLDMPYFEGPLIAPKRYLTSAEQIKLYVELSEQLNMEEWDEQLYTFLETVSNTYDGLTEKLFYHKGFTMEVMLEIAIVLVLLIDMYYNLIE